MLTVALPESLEICDESYAIAWPELLEVWYRYVSAPVEPDVILLAVGDADVPQERMSSPAPMHESTLHEN